MYTCNSVRFVFSFLIFIQISIYTNVNGQQSGNVKCATNCKCLYSLNTLQCETAFFVINARTMINSNVLHIYIKSFDSAMLDGGRLNSGDRVVSFSLNRSPLKEIKADFFSGESSIEFLDISFNEIEVLNINIFKFMLNLKVLNISNNPLTHIADGTMFDDTKILQNLQLLNMANTRLLHQKYLLKFGRLPYKDLKKFKLCLSNPRDRSLTFEYACDCRTRHVDREICANVQYTNNIEDVCSIDDDVFHGSLYCVKEYFEIPSAVRLNKTSKHEPTMMLTTITTTTKTTADEPTTPSIMTKKLMKMTTTTMSNTIKANAMMSAGGTDKIKPVSDINHDVETSEIITDTGMIAIVTRFKYIIGTSTILLLLIIINVVMYYKYNSIYYNLICRLFCLKRPATPSWRDRINGVRINSNITRPPIVKNDIHVAIANENYNDHYYLTPITVYNPTVTDDTARASFLSSLKCAPVSIVDEPPYIQGSSINTNDYDFDDYMGSDCNDPEYTNANKTGCIQDNPLPKPPENNIYSEIVE